MEIRRFFLKIILLALFLATPLFCGADLHPFFKQNGDCYLLVGEGPHRGVYALNNLTTGVSKKLYDPMDAYGLTAAQNYAGSVIQKWLYTFSGTNTGWESFTGLAERRVVVNATWNTYAANVVPPFIVHRWHGSPFNSPTGRGNHPQSTLNWKFGGFDYPCSQVPAAVSGKPGYYKVQMGKFYHAMDRPVKSPFAYGGYYAPGYWVHWVVRENSLVKYRDLKLYEFNVTSNSGPIAKSSLPRVKIEEKLTLDKRGECVDGCISQSDGEVLPGGMTPYLDTAYASSISKSYLYSREPNKTDYTLHGYISGKDVLIGNPSDLSTKFIGVSSTKYSNSSYLYCLGKSVVNKWMTDAAAPPGMLVTDISDLAVSDQWWQTGGIVYAYDKTKRKVYKFVRREGFASGIPEEISVNDDGIAPDSIGVDGFGHLYLVKTSFEPEKVVDFKPKDAYLVETNPMWPGMYRAYFKQNVYKSVFKRDYYTKNISQIPGKLLLGSNKFYRDFSATLKTDYSTWKWLAAAVQYGPVVQTEYKTELAVINSATPPEVTNTDAVCDVVGPMKISGTSVIYEAKPEYAEDEFYVFDVENSPDFDVNGVNTGNYGDDVDGDLRIGRFPSTTHEPSVLYYWKIIQLKDRFGNEVYNEVMNQEKDGTPGDYRLVKSFPGGEYKVGVKTKYKYYDYNLLKPGDMSDKKDTVLTGYKIAAGEDTDGYSWVSFKVKYYPPPPDPKGEGVVMTGKPKTATTYDYRPTSSNAQYHNYGWTDPTPTKPVYPKYVIKEGVSNWSFKIRESLTNLQAGIDRIANMKLAVPPHPNPGDPKIVPGSIKWIGDSPSYSYTSDIKWINGEGMNVRIDTNREYITAGEIAKLFRVPSQPQTYKLTVKGSRAYEYKQFIYDFAKNEWKDINIPKVISIEATAYVYVTDETGPAVKFNNPYYDVTSPKPGIEAESPAFFCSTGVLWGTTGEHLTKTDGKTNPANIEFIVADNNPNAFAPTGTYKDQFFTENVMSHNTVNIHGRYFYTLAGGGLMPCGTEKTHAAIWNYYKSNVFSNPQVNKEPYKLFATNLTKTTFESTSWLSTANKKKFNPSFSYRKYTIKVADINHYSIPDPAKPTTYSGEMAYTYANNQTGYKNLEFGLFWMEPNGMKWDTGSYCKGGELVVRDNDRPNIFVKMVDTKYDDREYVGPGKLNPSAWGSWKNLALKTGKSENRNGVESWTTDVISGIYRTLNPALTYVYSDTATNKFAQTGDNTKLLVEPGLEVDVPAFFNAIVSDNTTGNPAIKEFSIRAKDALAGSENVFKTDDKIKYLFRDAGEYRVKLVVEDNALGWPADYLKPTIASSEINKRILELILKVYSTKLDVRILERKREGM